jgi:hypothetical protein
MPQKIAGTFASAGATAAGQKSDVLVVPTGTASVVFTLSGDVDANNTVALRRSVNGGQSYGNAQVFSAPGDGTFAVGDIPGFPKTHWRVDLLTGQPSKNIQYSLSAES